MTDEPNPSEGEDSDGGGPDKPAFDEDARAGGEDVLSPEELDVSDSEYVEELDDSGRYVVSPGGGPPNVPDDDDAGSSGESGGHSGVTGPAEGPAPAGQSSGGQPPSQGMTSPEMARSLLADELGRADSRYGMDIVAEFNGESVRHRTVSNDVVATFENLVQWYAQHVTDDTPADEVIEILLNESSFVDPEAPNLAQLLDAHDLETSDSIGELVEAIQAESESSRRGD